MTRNPIVAFASRNASALKAVTVALFLSGLLFSAPLFTQTPFDVRSVLPKNCKQGKLECFGSNENAAEDRAVPLDASAHIKHRGLPSSVDLSSNLPPVGSQGGQGSCVAWTTAYYIKSMQEKVERRWSYNAGPGNSSRCNGSASRIFSPAYVYNQINGGRDRGSSRGNAARLMVQQGIAPCNYMPYNVRDYRTQPNSSARRAARKFKNKSYRRFTCNQIDAMKAVLAKGNPLAAGFKVTREMYRLNSSNNYVWHTFSNPRGGHAMAIVGYDDNRRYPGGRGAFKIVNSWGTGFGDRGFLWISYTNYRRACNSSYVIYDEKTNVNPSPGPGPNPGPGPVSSKLSPPRSVTASRGTYSSKIVVSWSPVSGASAYEVQRKDPGSTGFRRAGFARNRSYTDTSIQTNAAYTYRIVAVNDSTRSDASSSPTAQGYAKTSNRPRKPGRVVGVTGTAAEGRVFLRWSPAAGATSYRVMRYDSRGRRWRTLTSRVRSTSYTDTRPVRNASNYYAVRARNSAGVGRFSAPKQINVSAPVRPTVKPARPGSITASRGTFRRKVELRWTRVQGATGYMVYRYNYDERKWSVIARPRGTSFNDESSVLSRGAWFGYSVAAVNSAGRGPFARSVVGKTSPNAKRGTILPAPKVTASTRRGATVLRWKRVKGASEYYIFRKKDGGDFKFIKGVGASTRSFRDSVPEKGVLYFYSVKTKSLLGGESENSNIVSGFVNAEQPVIKRRFIPGEGLKRFEGTWTAWQMTSRDSHKVELKVSVSGARYTVRITRDGRRTGTVRGTYVAKSNSIEVDGFQMKLADSAGQAAEVEISSRRYYRGGLNLTFTK